MELKLQKRWSSTGLDWLTRLAVMCCSSLVKLACSVHLFDTPPPTPVESQVTTGQTGKAQNHDSGSPAPLWNWSERPEQNNNILETLLLLMLFCEPKNILIKKRVLVWTPVVSGVFVMETWTKGSLCFLCKEMECRGLSIELPTSSMVYPRSLYSRVPMVVENPGKLSFSFGSWNFRQSSHW